MKTKHLLCSYCHDEHQFNGHVVVKGKSGVSVFIKAKMLKSIIIVGQDSSEKHWPCCAVCKQRPKCADPFMYMYQTVSFIEDNHHAS